MVKVKVRFQAILVSGGYNFDLGDNVFEWRTTPLEAADLPAIVFRDVEKTNESEGTEKWHTNNLHIEVEIRASEGATTPKDIRKMIGDVYKAIGVDETWGELAARTNKPSNEMGIEQNESIIAGATIKFSIVCAYSVWNAYIKLP